MTYAAWEPKHRLTTIRPGKIDLFTVTLIDGKAADIDSVTDYDVALSKAQSFHAKHPCQIKVLAMTGIELRNFLGITLPDRPKPIDAEVVQQITGTLMRVARESSDPDARSDALQLLTEMGVVTV
jgi:hypothetical protein